MNSPQRSHARFVPMLLAALLCGCGPAGPRKSQVANAAGPPKGQQPVQGAVTAQGITIHWQERQPDGTYRHVLDVEAKTGSLESGTESGSLTAATGRFYRENRARASFVARQVNADRAKNEVSAQGNVVVTSVDPAGVTVRADRVVWNASRNKITASGHVTIEHTAPGATGRDLWGGPYEHATFRTDLDRFTIP